MSQLQLQDKLRKIAEVVKNGDQMNERPKKIGLLLFFICAFVGIVSLFLLALLLAVNRYVKTALFLMLIAMLFFYIIYKLITADDLSSL